MHSTTDRIVCAFAFAAEKHRTQARKRPGGLEVPYLTHVMSVSALVGEHGGDEEQMMAALLHDCVEDCGVTEEDLVVRFGPRVARIVLACTDSTLGEGPLPWRERKERYLARLEAKPAECKLVSCADKLHNARSIVADAKSEGDAFWKRFRGKSDVRWYYRALLTALETGWSSALVPLLREEVEAIERFV